MSGEIIKVLDALSEKVGIAVDWTSANVIPYLQQICTKMVNYELWTSIAWIVISFIPIILLCILVKYSCKHEDTFDECSDIIFPIGVGLAIISVFGIIVATVQVFDIIACLTFPEKIILNQIQYIYNGMTAN